MLDIDEARKILGLNNYASKNDIENRYSILLKKSKAQNKAADNGDALKEDAIDINKITKAYNILMGYEEPETEEEINQEKFADKHRVDKEKANNFLYYYKVHIIVGIILLVFLVFGLKSCLTRVEHDFSLAFIGKIDYTSTDLLKNELKSNIPEIKEPEFDSAYVTLDEKSPSEETAMIQKAMVIMVASETDMYILDKDLFEIYAKDGYFEPLEASVTNIGVETKSEKALYAKAESDTEEHLYGIDITDSSILKKAGISGKSMVAAVSVNSKRKDKALEAVKLFNGAVSQNAVQ